MVNDGLDKATTIIRKTDTSGQLFEGHFLFFFVEMLIKIGHYGPPQIY